MGFEKSGGAFIPLKGTRTGKYVTGNVGFGGNPDASAFLDIQSTVKGVALPAMTTAQRDAIPAPKAGLIIFNATTGLYNFYNGSAWLGFASTTGSFIPLSGTTVGNNVSGNILFNNSTKIYSAAGASLFWNSAGAIVMTPGSSSLISFGGGSFANDGVLDASAIFQINSTSKGFILPSMTTTQRNAISSPATGLCIYNTTNGNFEYYNGTAWILGFPDQTEWTEVAFDAGNFTGTTWTVESGDVLVNRYKVVGKTLFWNLDVASSTIADAPTFLRVTIPGGHTLKGSIVSPCVLYNNAGTAEVAGVNVAAGVTYLNITRLTGSFANGTNSQRLGFNMSFEIE